MPPLESLDGLRSLASLALDMFVSSSATSVIGLFSLYAFFAINAAFSYPIIGLSAVTKIGFFCKDSFKLL